MQADKADPPGRRTDPAAILWAYRLFLGREPESDEVVQLKLREFPTLAALCSAFLASEEFQQQRRGQARPSLDGFEPPMRIVPVTSAGDLQRLFAHIQATWQRLGETEPHWSVLTSSLFKQENLAASRDDFYATGKHCLVILKAALERCGIDHHRLATGIEYGCGVGRVTQWLAGHLQTLHAYDISSAHLHIAREHLSNQGRTNVEYHHVRQLDDLAALPKVDLVYSCIVLQHNPPPIIEVMLARLLGAIKPGGIGYIQLPTYLQRYGFELSQYLAHAERVREVEMHAVPQRRVFELVRAAGCVVLEVLDDDTWTGLGHHSLSNVFVVRKEA